MVAWDSFVEFLRLFILTQSQICGGNLGCGIALASFLFRAALFPLTLKVARSSLLHQRAVERIRPELMKLQKRFEDAPQKRFDATQALFKKHGIRQLPLAGCFATLAQTPLFIAFFSAVREVSQKGGRLLWIGNIAKPDAMLTVAVSGLTLASVALSASPAASNPDTRRMMLILPVVVTAVMLAQTSAGVALYFGVSSTVSTLQNYLLRRSVPAT